MFYTISFNHWFVRHGITEGNSALSNINWPHYYIPTQSLYYVLFISLLAFCYRQQIHIIKVYKYIVEQLNEIEMFYYGVVYAHIRHSSKLEVRKQVEIKMMIDMVCAIVNQGKQNILQMYKYDNALRFFVLTASAKIIA